MCVVKVKRVESDTVGLSNKELLHNTSPVKTDLKAETDAYIEPHPFHESGETNRTTEDSGQWPKATQLHPGTDELQSFSHEQHGLSTSQHCTIRDFPPENKKMQLVLDTASTSNSEVSVGPSDPEMQTSRRQDSSSQTPNTDDSMDTGTENIHNCNSDKPDRVCDLKHTTPQCNTEAPLCNLQTEPVGGGSCTSFHTQSPSRLNCNLEKNSTEESIFPPLLQRNSIDMPLLTPEPEDKTSISLLPPVLTQEMPSLTPAHDGIPNVSRPASCNNRVAPVLQREVPTSSLSSHPAGKDKQVDCVMPEHVNSWHLALLYNCEVAATSGSHGNAAHLSGSFTHNTTSGGVHDMRKKHDIAAETGHTEPKNVSTEQNGASPYQLVRDNSQQSEQDCISAKLTSIDNLKHLGSRADVLSLSSAGSLLTSASNNSSAPPPSLCTEAVVHSALELHHSSAYSHCTSSTTYIEPKPFSSSIWRNLNSHSPAVLIQSLNPELSSDFTHDPLPYTIWTEPQCKEVTDLESSEHELHLSKHQEEEGRPLTWAQLEPTSLVSVGAVESLGLCGDYELQRSEVERSEALSVSAEMGRKIEESKFLKSGTVVSAAVIGGEHYEEGSDLEEGACDSEEAEEQCNVREEESSDLSDEEVEEAFSQNYQCAESGLEPGEICAVSVHLCTVTYLVCCLNLTKKKKCSFSILSIFATSTLVCQ